MKILWRIALTALIVTITGPIRHLSAEQGPIRKDFELTPEMFKLQPDQFKKTLELLKLDTKLTLTQRVEHIHGKIAADSRGCRVALPPELEAIFGKPFLQSVVEMGKTTTKDGKPVEVYVHYLVQAYSPENANQSVGPVKDPPEFQYMLVIFPQDRSGFVAPDGAPFDQPHFNEIMQNYARDRACAAPAPTPGQKTGIDAPRIRQTLQDINVGVIQKT